MSENDLAPAPAVQFPYPADDALSLGGVTIHGSKEERKALFASLAKAQGSYEAIARTRTVKVRSDKGDYTFDYAPLENVLAATMPSLNGNGLALLNATSDEEEGKALHTLLTHEGGAVMHMTMRMPGVSKPQDLGAQITYARRYSIQCVTGTSPEFDDDGNAGSGNKVESYQDKKQRTPPRPPEARREANTTELSFREADAGLPRREPSAPTSPPEREGSYEFAESTTGEPIKPDQKDEIIGELKRLGIRGIKATELAKQVTGRTGDEMTVGDGVKFLAHLRGL